MLSLNKISDLAQDFTQALKSVLKTASAEETESMPFMMCGNFPNGGCAISSRYFGKMLFPKLSTELIRAVCKRKEEQEHYWLRFNFESRIGIIDLTCSQFGDCNLDCPFVSTDDRWHTTNWHIKEQTPIQNAHLDVSDASLFRQIKSHSIHFRETQNISNGTDPAEGDTPHRGRND